MQNAPGGRQVAGQRKVWGNELAEVERLKAVAERAAARAEALAKEEADAAAERAARAHVDDGLSDSDEDMEDTAALLKKPLGNKNSSPSKRRSSDAKLDVYVVCVFEGDAAPCSCFGRRRTVADGLPLSTRWGCDDSHPPSHVRAGRPRRPTSARGGRGAPRRALSHDGPRRRDGVDQGLLGEDRRAQAARRRLRHVDRRPRRLQQEGGNDRPSAASDSAQLRASSTRMKRSGLARGLDA